METKSYTKELVHMTTPFYTHAMRISNHFIASILLVVSSAVSARESMTPGDAADTEHLTSHRVNQHRPGQGERRPTHLSPEDRQTLRRQIEAATLDIDQQSDRRKKHE